MPVWIAVGGTPQSVIRAGTLGLPMALAVSINSHGFIADTTDEAIDIAFPPYVEVMGRIGRERGWPPPTRRQFDTERSPRGAMLLGEPQAVIDKILHEHELFGMQRFLIQFTVGPRPHDKVMRSIELFGTKVAPVIRARMGLGTGPALDSWCHNT